MSRAHLLLLALVASASSPLRAAAQPVPVGSEFQVNTYTTSDQGSPAVASDAAGNVVVVWQSFGSAGTDTSNSSIQGQRYDSTGAPQGGEFQVNAYTTSRQRAPAVASGGAGNFVVAWQSYGSSSGTEPTGYSIQAQRYDSTGTPQGGQFKVNTYTPSYQHLPKVALDGAGNFVVVWESNGSAGTDTERESIQGQRYDSTGATQGGEFQVNTYTTYRQLDPAVASDATGNFVVVWRGPGDDADGGFGIFGQRYDSTGAALGGEFLVNTYTTGSQHAPAVASDPVGNFVVVWPSPYGDGTDTEMDSIQAQRYDSNGARQGQQFQVNTYTTGTQFVPKVATDSAGNFVVVWQSNGSAGTDTSNVSIQGQRYDSTGGPQGGQFQVNSYTTGYQRAPAVATVGAGNFVVVWTSEGSAGTDTAGFSIQGQRFSIVGTTSSSSSTSSTSTSSTSSTTSTSTTLPTTLLPGRVAIIKPGTLAKFVAKPATGDAFMLPAASTVAMGGALRVFDTTFTAGDVTFALPVTGWISLGPAGSKGYKYKGAGTIGDPCKVVLVKENIIKGVCKGTGVTLTPPFTGYIGVVLSLGVTDRYCAQFGGDEVRNDDTLTKRKNAPAPGACP